MVLLQWKLTIVKNIKKMMEFEAISNVVILFMLVLYHRL